MLQQSDGPWFDSGWPDIGACADQFAAAALLAQQMRKLATKALASVSSRTGKEELLARERLSPAGALTARVDPMAICISRESNPGHIDGNDVFCH